MKHIAIPKDSHQRGLEAYFGDDLDLRGLPAIKELEHLTIVAFVNRSGSNYLCSLLSQMGLAGPGTFEPLNAENAMVLSKPRGIKTFRDYMTMIATQHRSRSGCVTIKASCPQLNMLANAGLFSYGQKNPKIIYSTRRNVIAQACSYVMATQTGAWNSSIKGTSPAQFDEGKILQTAAEITLLNSRFELLFDYYGFNPVRVLYEDLEADAASQVQRIAAAYGIAAPERIGQTSIEKQVDPAKGEWEARVRAHHDFTP